MTATTATRLTGPRKRIIEALEQAGGSIYNSSGLAVRDLELLLGDVKTSLPGVLSKMESKGMIVREIKGRRTFTIRLPDAQFAELNGAQRERFDEVHDALKQATGEERLELLQQRRELDQQIATPPEPIDYLELADSLLRRVAEVLQYDPKLTDGIIQKMTNRAEDLESQLEGLRARATRAEEEAARLRGVNERLQSQLRQTEANLDAMLRGKRNLDEVRRQMQGERGFAALDALIRERPSAKR